jgi:hypothetical protein
MSGAKVNKWFPSVDPVAIFARFSVDRTLIVGRSVNNSRAQAEVLALRALGWVAGDEGRLGAFLSLSGTAPDQIAAQARNGVFLGAVLDFLLSDDGLVTGFCTDAGLPFDAPMRARAALPGGAVPDWT